MLEKGKYIVIEGHDGTGKSTQVALLREALRQQGIESVEIHEPAGIEIADRLRDIIKDGTLKRDATTNLLLFTATRRELWNQLAKPALENGEWVIAARNWYSTLAYQGYGEGLSSQLIEQITRDFTDEHYAHPNFACILTLPDTKERHRRISQRAELEKADTFESKSRNFQANVEKGYDKIARDLHLPTIDATPSPEAIHANILRHLNSSGLTYLPLKPPVALDS